MTGRGRQSFLSIGPAGQPAGLISVCFHSNQWMKTEAMSSKRGQYQQIRSLWLAYVELLSSVHSFNKMNEALTVHPTLDILDRLSRSPPIVFSKSQFWSSHTPLPPLFLWFPLAEVTYAHCSKRNKMYKRENESSVSPAPCIPRTLVQPRLA